MKVLVVGSGGREHAIGVLVAKNKSVTKVYFAPGNGGTQAVGENIPYRSDDIEGLTNFAQQNKIDITIVGPEIPLSLGIVDAFREKNLAIFGPDQQATQLESSKSFAKKFMNAYGIPTGDYQVFESVNPLMDYLSTASYPIVLKADGLAGGKGVFICQDFLAAGEAADKLVEEKLFAYQGRTLLVEEFLEGKEVSLLCFTDGKTIVPMESASDYKRVFDGDLGANTGGMGSISPSPYYINGSCADIIRKTLQGIQKEQLWVKGIVYIGIILTKEGPKVLEYNMRFGDPETQSLLLRLETDFMEIVQRIIKEELDQILILWKKEKAVTVVMASKGYPEESVGGAKIILPPISEETAIFHGSTQLDENGVLSMGGRVLSISAIGETFEKAKAYCYDTIARIDFEDCIYRTDIGELTNE